MRALVPALALSAWALNLVHVAIPHAPWRGLADASSQTCRGGGQRTVRVDVIATDGRARAVETLEPADFELREDGAPQTIEEARFIKVDKTGAAGDRLLQIQSEADERAEASRPNTRLFAVFFEA